MDSTTALDRADHIVSDLIAGLTPDDREAPTPCSGWTVHDLIAHMCSGGHMIAGGLQGQAPPENSHDYLADGPAAGWTGTIEALRAVATPEILSATHQMPFGEVPGEVAMSVIVADFVTHGWDLAQASGQQIEVDDELAGWALDTWRVVVPAEGRTGGGFAPVIPVDEGASALDRLVGYTGRQP